MPSSNWTPEQFRAHEARMRMSGVNRDGEKPPPDNGANNEVELQDAIIGESRRRGWWVDYSRMDLPTTRPKGAPDIYVFADDGRLFIIECKTKTGKIRPEQLGVSMMLEKLGHKVHVVRSFQQFLDLTTLG